MKTKKEPKIFFVDLDGTLLDKAGHEGVIKKLSDKVSLKNKEAIKKIQKVKPIIISTGRPPKLVLPLIQELNIPYAITQNGSWIINQKGNVVYKKEMTLKTVLKILDFAKKHKLVIKMNDSATIHGAKGIMKFIIKKIGMKSQEGYQVLESELEKHKTFQKFVLAGKTRRKIRLLCKELNEASNDMDIVAVTSSKGFSIELTDTLATKGLANAFVANKLGYKNEDAAHLGDTMNDCTAKGIMGYLVVMKNASKELKKMATHNGPHYRNGGVAEILNWKEW